MIRIILFVVLLVATIPFSIAQENISVEFSDEIPKGVDLVKIIGKHKNNAIVLSRIRKRMFVESYNLKTSKRNFSTLVESIRTNPKFRFRVEEVFLMNNSILVFGSGYNSLKKSLESKVTLLSVDGKLKEREKKYFLSQLIQKDFLKNLNIFYQMIKQSC